MALVVVVLVSGWVARRRPVAAVAVLAACAVVEVGVNTTRWYPSVDTGSAYPAIRASAIVAERGGRVVRVGDRTVFGPLGADVPMVYGDADADGQAVFLSRDYDRYRRLIDDYGSFARDLSAVPPLADGTLATSPLLDALDVRTVVADPGVAVPPAYAVVDAGTPVVYARPAPGPAVVVQSPNPLPRRAHGRR